MCVYSKIIAKDKGFNGDIEWKEHALFVQKKVDIEE